MSSWPRVSVSVDLTPLLQGVLVGVALSPRRGWVQAMRKLAAGFTRSVGEDLWRVADGLEGKHG